LRIENHPPHSTNFKAQLPLPWIPLLQISSSCAHAVFRVAPLLAEDYVTKWRFTIGCALLVQSRSISSLHECRDRKLEIPINVYFFLDSHGW